MPEYRIKPGGMHDQAFRSRKKIKMIGGGFGNGKTASGCVQAILLAQSYPGSNGLIAMASYAQLNDTIREEFYKWIPASSVKRWPTIADNTMILKNGSKINFRYLKQKGKAAAADCQTSSNLLSATYDWVVIDQIENPEITYKDFLDVLGRLRGSTPYRGTDDTMPRTGPRWLIMLANPAFNWVYHKLIKPLHHWKKTGERHPDLIWDEELNEPMIELFEASTYENAHNLEPDFIKGLEAAYKGQFRDRYLGGNWGAFEGLVYPSFSVEKHMISKEIMLNYLYTLGHQFLTPTIIDAFDFGIASPSCYLVGFRDHRGRIFVVDGFYEKELTVQQIGEMIWEKRADIEPYCERDTSMLADPAIFKRTIMNKIGEQATTIANLLNTNAQIYAIPAQNDMMGGIAKVASYLSVQDFPHFLTGEPNGCLIYFASHLTFIPDEFGSYFWKMNANHERTDEPIDRNDHAMDTIKYMFSYFPAVEELMYNFSEKVGAIYGQRKY